MPYLIRIHWENTLNIPDPHLWAWTHGSTVQNDVAPAGQDGFGLVFDLEVVRPEFNFKFKSGLGIAGPWEPSSLDRVFAPQLMDESTIVPNEIWSRGDRAFVYDVEPKRPEVSSAGDF
ncbi:MAG TPA: hypothetical protein VK633_05840, partial [Verrucomicrobiae bacterium]|nr:hypothetical protein [Verrucomicrobiae bacterium]